jgi:hypothetical protein
MPPPSPATSVRPAASTATVPVTVSVAIQQPGMLGSTQHIYATTHAPSITTRKTPRTVHDALTNADDAWMCPTTAHNAKVQELTSRSSSAAVVSSPAHRLSTATMEPMPARAAIARALYAMPAPRITAPGARTGIC